MPVRAGRADREEVAGREREMPVVREEIGALADRADDVPVAARRPARGRTGVDRMPRVVERGTQQVVHRRVDDREVRRGARLQVFDARQQHAGVADETPAGLEQQPFGAPREQARAPSPRTRRRAPAARRGSGCRGRRPGRRARARCRRRAARSTRSSILRDRLAVRRELGDLRADVDVDAAHRDVRQRRRAPVERAARRRRRRRTCSP